MFANLKAALYRKCIPIKEYARFLSVSEKTARSKLNCTTEFTYTEFKKTCNLLPDYSADYLFATEDGISATAPA